MGKTLVKPSFQEQRDAYLDYVLMASKRTIRKKMQHMIDVREEELLQAGENAGDAMKFGYIGYRMALEDLYFDLYGENIPEVKNKTTIDWINVDV